MPRQRRIPVNPLPRVTKKNLTDKQERFARVYAATLDADEAFRQAGYEHATDDSRNDAKCRLLRNPYIRALVDQILSEIASKYHMDAEGVVARLKLIYLEAMKKEDYSGAVSALRELGKYYGIYEKHNKQKRYGPEDAEKLREELKKVGFSFDRVNFPSEN